MKEADMAALVRADNQYVDEDRDIAKSSQFADILRRRHELETKLGELRHQERALQSELDALGGLRVGDIVLLEDGRRARLNSVRAEPFIALHGNLMYLRITGECSPLTAGGQPNKREVHKRFRHVRWEVEAPFRKLEASSADDEQVRAVT